MFGYGKLAACTTLTAGLAALAMLAAVPAQASTTSATTARPTVAARSTAALPAAALGSYGTWRRAQRAAGFRLRKPSRTFGLVRTHPILVGKCQASGKGRKRDVYASWQRRSTFLALDQNNSGGACSNFGDAKYLGRYRVQGHWAALYGFCGRSGMPSCRKRNFTLVLVWRSGSSYYVAYSHNEWRRTLVSFGRSLVRI
jgi:hypothetical protein